jgi:heme-degrading monooxygenase HmoA
MIARLWRGWASPANAPLYADFLAREFLPELRHIDGYGSVEVLQRDEGGEVEFLVITRWRTLEAIKAFAGDDAEAAHVAPRARELLSRFEDRCRHYQAAGS